MKYAKVDFGLGYFDTDEATRSYYDGLDYIVLDKTMENVIFTGSYHEDNEALYSDEDTLADIENYTYEYYDLEKYERVYGKIKWIVKDENEDWVAYDDFKEVKVNIDNIQDLKIYERKNKIKEVLKK